MFEAWMCIELSHMCLGKIHDCRYTWCRMTRLSIQPCILTFWVEKAVRPSIFRKTTYPTEPLDFLAAGSAALSRSTTTDLVFVAFASGFSRYSTSSSPAAIFLVL